MIVDRKVARDLLSTLDTSVWFYALVFADERGQPYCLPFADIYDLYQRWRQQEFFTAGRCEGFTLFEGQWEDLLAPWTVRMQRVHLRK
jgi:hypothetical protein